MSIKGNGNTAIRKKGLTNTRNPTVTPDNVKIHHQATLGDKYIDLTNLVVPVGLLNPSPNKIALMRLKDASANWFLTSNKRTLFIEGAAYEIDSNVSIKLKAGYEALEDEVFVIQYFNYVVNGTVLADVRPAGDSGVLLAGERDFNLGEAIPIENLINQYPINIMRGKRKISVLRNTGNDDYIVPVPALSSDIYNDIRYINSVALEGNDGRAITGNTEDVHFSGSGVGWSSVGDDHIYTIQKEDSVLNFTVAILFTNANNLISIYKNGTVYKSISSTIVEDSHVGTYISAIGEFAKDDEVSFRVTTSGTITDNVIYHYLNIIEEADIESPPSVGDYKMIDRGDGYCQVIRFNVEGAVGNEEVFWASHGALGERPNLSVLQRVDKINGIVNKLREDSLINFGFDISDPTRYEGGVPTDSDLKSFGDKVLALDSIFNTPIFFETPWALLPVQPTLGGSGGSTVNMANFYWRRQGQDVEIKGSLSTSAGSGGSVVLFENLLNQFDYAPAPINPAILGGADEVLGYAEAYQWQSTAQFRRLTMYRSGINIGILNRDTNTTMLGSDIKAGGAAIFLKFQVTGWQSTQTIKQKLGL